MNGNQDESETHKTKVRNMLARKRFFKKEER